MTEKDKLDVLRRYSNGESVAQIARTISYSARMVAIWVNKAGIIRPRKTIPINKKLTAMELYEKGYKAKDLAAIFNVAESTIFEWGRKYKVSRPKTQYENKVHPFCPVIIDEFRRAGLRSRKYKLSDLGLELRCTRCKEYWPADTEFFPVESTLKSGLNSHCNACHSDYHNMRK